VVPAGKSRQLTVAPILVLGATGMLGQALITAGRARGLPVLGAARAGADMAVDLEDVEALLPLVSKVRPGIIVNAAALADLACCEREPGRAYMINARCVAVLAEAARGCGAWLVQVSTDHYFSGDGALPHGEDSPVRLLNEYARGKYAGENFALTCPGALAVRTNIVGFRGWGVPTFVEWILEEFAQGRTIQAFEDYFVSSMTVRQFAAALFELMPMRPAGVLNLGAREVFSKRDFIEAVRDNLLGGVGKMASASVRALGGARRAESLGLDVGRAELLLGRLLPTLAEVAADLAAEYQERNACVTTA
jgi:dTDP-4-dehydrorhamnose reductase